MVEMAGNATAAIRQLAACQTAASAAPALPVPIMVLVGMLATVIVLLGKPALPFQIHYSLCFSVFLLTMCTCCRTRRTRSSARRCLAEAEALLKHYSRKHAVTPDRRARVQESLELLNHVKQEP